MSDVQVHVPLARAPWVRRCPARARWRDWFAEKALSDGAKQLLRATGSLAVAAAAALLAEP